MNTPGQLQTDDKRHRHIISSESVLESPPVQQPMADVLAFLQQAQRHILYLSLETRTGAVQTLRNRPTLCNQFHAKLELREFLSIDY